VMTTLNDMTAKKKSEPSAEEIAARELVRVAKEQGLSLTGPDGLLKQFTKWVLETALNEEMTEHLGHEKNRAPVAPEATNVRNGTHRARQGTMEHALEASTQRVRDHLRRPLAGSRNLLMEAAGNTVNETVPCAEPPILCVGDDVARTDLPVRRPPT